MSVGSVGNGGNSAALAMLYKQLVRDEQQLVRDVASHAAKEVIAVDQVRVTADQAEIMAAQQRQLVDQQQARLAAALTRGSAGR